MTRDAWVVFQKEALEARRDRRTLIASLLLPILVVPVVALGMPALARRQEAALRTVPARVAVMGWEYAGLLVDAGARSGVLVPTHAADPEAALRRGEIDLVMVLPPGFDDAARRTAPIVLLFNGGELASLVAREKVGRFISEHARRAARARLLAQGLDPALLGTVALCERDVTADRHSGGPVLARLLPFLIAVWTVLGGMHVAVDVTAGERERGTLEVLLSVPVSRGALIAGKFLTVTAAALAAVAAVLVATMTAFRWAGPQAAGGAAPTLAAGDLALLVGTLVPLVAVVSAIALAIGLLARSVREAQQYLMPLYLAIALPAMAIEFLPHWARASWTAAVPVLNSLVGMRRLLLGTAAPDVLLLSAATNAGTALLLLALAVVLISREGAFQRA